MKPSCVALLFCLMCSAQTKSAAQHKAPVKDAAFADSALIAYDSIHSLWLNVEASEVGFQPRQIDAEKNLAVAEHKAKTDEDKRQLEILKSWSRLLDRHRYLFAHGESGTSVRVLKLGIPEITCSVEAAFIFKPSELTEEGKKMAQISKCVEDTKSAILDSY